MELNTNGSLENGSIYYEYEEYDIIHVSRPCAKECAIAALCLQWLNSLLIIALNIAVIVTILRYKKKSRLYYLLMNMAIADLVTGMLAFVNSIERSLGIEYLNYYWFADDITCRIYKTVAIASMLASNFILAATSVDRAMVVAKPMMNFKRGFILQKSLIVLCWLLSVFVSSPLLIKAHKTMYSPSHMSNGTIMPYCDIGIKPQEWKAALWIYFVAAALIPLVIIITSYIILIHAIYKRARTPPNSIKGMDKLRISLVFNRGLPSSKTRSVKLTLGIVLSFITAWTPFFVLMFLNVFGSFNNPYVMPFVTTFYWNCIANPIVFFVFHRRRGTHSRDGTCSSGDVRLVGISNNSSRDTSIRGQKRVKMSQLLHDEAGNGH